MAEGQKVLLPCLIDTFQSTPSRPADTLWVGFFFIHDNAILS